MASQTEKGKAFEYACLKALYGRLSLDQAVEVIEDTSFLKAQGFYETLETDQANMDLAAQSSVQILSRLEPQLINSSKGSPLLLSLQSDGEGQKGDVRDVLCVRRQNKWEVGLSCKHNHSAVKHSRLAPHLDFGDKWFSSPCSSQYFDEIAPVFDELRELKHQQALWGEIDEKIPRFYVPILQSFQDELWRLYKDNPTQIAQGLIAYLIGRYDFYKIIANERNKLTEIQAFNMYGTLNKSAGKVKAVSNAPRTQLPNRILDIAWKNETTLIVTCDDGWVISLRIHNASSKVETSLKFDAQLIGVPSSLMKLQELW